MKATENGSIPAGLKLKGQAGDEFKVAGSDGANNLDFFFYELPFALVSYILFSLIFRMIFNYRISKYFRKYSFYGIFLFIVYEGKV